MHVHNDIGILTFVPDHWEGYWRPKHYIMTRLARYYKILWVSPPLNLKNIVNANSTKNPPRGLNKISPSLWAYSPEWYSLHLSKRMFGLKSLNSFLQSVRVKRIKSLLKQMGIKRLILYVWKPEYSSYVGKFNEEFVCYHVDDEYTFSEVDLPISAEESWMLKKSDAVFILSKSLLEKKGKLNSNTYYSPMGVDFDHYRKVVENENIHFGDIFSILKPRIGFVGYIKKQIDLELLLGIARKRKDWSIVLVGPISEIHTEIKEYVELLRLEDNVYFLGGKKHEELPGYIKEMDVCLMCYRNTAYTNYIFPLKLHEYLACGRPIVSTCLKNLKEFKEVLRFADTRDDWIEKIEECLKDNSFELEQKRIAVARENSWDERVKEIRSIIQEKLD